MAWKTDPQHTHIEFMARHMMISKVRGLFESFDIQVNLDTEHPENAGVEVTIDASSINSRDPQRDGHLKSPDFLDVENYPSVTFKSTRVERTGDNQAKLYGDLTIRDVAKPVVLDVTYTGRAKSPWGAESIGFSADTTINRKDWGLEWNQALETGGWLVGNEIAIHVETELISE
jgi:polyisoprenoid-binding protein YceI